MEPTSNSTRVTIANSTISAAMVSGWVSRFQCRNVAMTTAATAYAVASAATTPRSRLDIGRGWRARRSPTKRSSPLITYELSVLACARVNPGQVLQHFRPGKLQGACRLQRPVAPRPGGPWSGGLPGAASRLTSREGGRDPREVPLLLRRAGPCPRALGVAGAADVRPVRAAHHRGHAAVQALLPRGADPSGAATHLVPEGLPYHGHRERRAHCAAPHLLRDARQLLVRRLLQAGCRGVRVRPLDERLRLHARTDLGDRLRR